MCECVVVPAAPHKTEGPAQIMCFLAVWLDTSQMWAELPGRLCVSWESGWTHRKCGQNCQGGNYTNTPARCTGCHREPKLPCTSWSRSLVGFSPQQWSCLMAEFSCACFMTSPRVWKSLFISYVFQGKPGRTCTFGLSFCSIILENPLSVISQILIHGVYTCTPMLLAGGSGPLSVHSGSRVNGLVIGNISISPSWNSYQFISLLPCLWKNCTTVPLPSIPTIWQWLQLSTNRLPNAHSSCCLCENLILQLNNISLRAVHVPGCINTFYDTISRQQVTQEFLQCYGMRSMPTQVPTDLLPANFVITWITYRKLPWISHHKEVISGIGILCFVFPENNSALRHTPH